DHEHALSLEREAVRIEEVGGAVQGDDRLAGAGTTLHDEHATERRADDLVLLGLDGGDDVAETAGASALEGGDQRAPPDDAVEGAIGLVADEHLVLAVEHAPAAGGE